MAQWIARRTSNPEAVGSSPTERPVNMAREGITIQICATSIEKCLAIPEPWDSNPEMSDFSA